MCLPVASSSTSTHAGFAGSERLASRASVGASARTAALGADASWLHASANAQREEQSSVERVILLQRPPRGRRFLAAQRERPRLALARPFEASQGEPRVASGAAAGA